MANRDALWVDDKGRTIPVVVDEFGNRVDHLPTAEEVARARDALDAAPVPTKDRHILIDGVLISGNGEPKPAPKPRKRRA